MDFPTLDPRPSLVHRADGGFMSNPDGSYDWSRPRSPAEDTSKTMRTAREFWGCGYCGSMHPSELAWVLENGAHVHWADFKYGWPHKVYVDNAPNRYAGQLEIRQWGPGDKAGPEVPARSTAHAKFYTLHLQEATPEEREVIERAMGLRFAFEAGAIRWRRYV